MNTTQRNRSLVDKLRNSKLFREFEEAYSEITELPLTLRPLEFWELSHANNRHQNGFCGLVARNSRSCAACLRMQQEMCDAAQETPHTLTCPFGLSETAVPIRAGDQLIGYLQTGQILLKKPSLPQLAKAIEQFEEWGLKVDHEEARKLFFDTPVLSPGQYEFRIGLIKQFAEHLSLFANQIVVREQNSEHPMITRAKEYIHQHHAEEISLSDVAKNVHVSVFYLCKLFKEVTGLNFTDYVSRVRVEKAKDLLLNMNYRVSEIAYEVGFQSLTHFNRVFKRIVGQSPTLYRRRLPTG